MGFRGPGAGRMRRLRNAVDVKKRRLPWKNKNLTRSERVIAFLQWLPITKGKLLGKNMRLLPGQRKFVERVYGAKHRVRIAIRSEARGNGKTGLLSGLALCHLLGPESEQRGEVYSAAIDRKQAALIFAEMEAIIIRVPEFVSRVNIQRFHKIIEVLEGDGEGSVYESLSSDARRAHGLSPTLWVYDELAQAKDRILLDNLMTAMGKRDRSLGIVISTQAPDDDHPLSLLIDSAGSDESVVVDVLSAPMDADPFDAAVIKGANPALGIFLDTSDLLSEANRARNLPAFEPAFRNLRLNQRVYGGEEDRLVTVAAWKELGNEPIDFDVLEGRECFGGLDLSSKHDLTALVLVFPSSGVSRTYEIVPFFWTPEQQLDKRRPSERDQFRDWIRRGFIEAIPGPIIRYDFVARKIGELSRRFKITTIAYDRWRIQDLKLELGDIGLDLPLSEFGQGHSKVMAPAIEFFAECALTGRLSHGGHPVLTASVVNAIVIPDKAGNPMIDKPKSNRVGPVRVDGAVALVMALGTARRFERDPLIALNQALIERGGMAFV